MKRLTLRLLSNLGPSVKFGDVMYRLLISTPGRNKFAYMKTGSMDVCSGQSPVAKMLQGCLITKYVNTVMTSESSAFNVRKEIHYNTWRTLW